MPTPQPSTRRASSPPDVQADVAPLVVHWSRFWAVFHVVVAVGMMGWVGLLMWAFSQFALLIALGWVPWVPLLWFGLARLRDREPVLVMDARGVTDRRPPLRGRTVPWRDVRQVARGSNNRLLISLHPSARAHWQLGAGVAVDRALRSLSLDFGDLALNIGGLSARPGRLVRHAQQALQRVKTRLH